MPLQDKDKEYKEYVEKIKLYQQDFEAAKTKLTLMRTELAQQAKKTVVDLESSIVRLREENDKKQKVSADLDKMIAEKQSIFNKKEVNLELAYHNKESKMSAEYAEKNIKLKDKELEINERDSKVNQSAKLLNQRENALNDSWARLNAEQNMILQKQKEVQDGLSKLKDKQEKDKREVADINHSLKLKTDEIHRLAQDLVHREEAMKEKEAHVKAILDREASFDAQAKALAQQEQALKDREATINQSNVALQALRNNYYKDEKALKDKSKQLDIREQNLKDAEAKVV